MNHLTTSPCAFCFDYFQKAPFLSLKAITWSARKDFATPDTWFFSCNRHRGHGRHILEGWERLERQELTQEFSKAKSHRACCSCMTFDVLSDGQSFEWLVINSSFIFHQWERPPPVGRRGSTALVLDWIPLQNWLSIQLKHPRRRCQWKTKSTWKWSRRLKDQKTWTHMNPLWSKPRIPSEYARLKEWHFWKMSWGPGVTFCPRPQSLIVIAHFRQFFKFLFVQTCKLPPGCLQLQIGSESASAGMKTTISVTLRS